jgi:glutathione S-transferase
MKLYAIPFACSLACHVALREAALDHEIHWVVRTTKVLEDGRDLRTVSPKGKVATLVYDDGTLLTENVAVLLAIAELAPAARLAPPAGTLERLRLHEWLSFVATELHKQVLWAFFDPFVPVVMKEHVTQRVLPEILEHAARALAERPFLLGEDFSVADAYLYWALLLVPRVGASLEPYPALLAFRDRVSERKSVRDTLVLEKRALSRMMV